MDVRQFAEQVLFGATLSEKLARPPARLGDAAPGAPRAVSEPSRPVGLALSRRERAPLPGLHELRSDDDRARVLRALANHELLALELFALALLRFPDAPAGLRRGWVASMRDEQRHLEAYLARLGSTGHALEEEPLSAFFWDALAGVSDARAFVAGLQVCLEQANLDFARAWAVAFREAGDPATAAVLDEVYEDEIRHLRVGVTWLRRLGEPGADPFDDFADALAFPLTVARARGPSVDRAGRRRAGLSEAFVDRLEVTEVSRGRQPTVRWLDPHAEDDVAGRAVADSPVARDLAVLPALASATGDVVVAPTPPTGFLQRWREVGFVVPQFVPSLDPEHLPGGQAGALAPWAWTPASAAAASALGGRWDERWRRLFSKVWAAEVLAEVVREPGPWTGAHVGVPCGSWSEVVAARARFHGDVLVKAAFSTSGQHRRRVVGALTEAHRRWVERQVHPVLVEPVLDVVAEVSVHVDVTETGVRDRGIVRFLAHRGVFRGVVVGSPTVGLEGDVARFLHEARAWERLAAVAGGVGERAREVGYAGPIGVDVLVVREAGRLWLKPISEVNPRVTMGRLGLGLRKRIHGVGLWAFVPMKAVRAAGHGSAEAMVRAAREALPDVMVRGRLAQGVVATNEAPEQVLTVLFVGRRWETVVEAATGAGALAPEAPRDHNSSREIHEVDQVPTDEVVQVAASRLPTNTAALGLGRRCAKSGLSTELTDE